MALAEIAFRVRERVSNRAERFAFERGGLSRPDRLRKALRRDLGRKADWAEALLDERHTSPSRFYPGVHSRATMRELFESRFHAEAAATRGHAHRARSHLFEFFGHSFEAGAQIDWHRDPISGAHWPRTYHGDVPIHQGDVGFGDVKFVWELNRHQFLIDLGKACFLEGTPADAAEIREVVRSWMADNPYACGVNWACALEPAFRAQSWLWAYHLSFDAVCSDENEHLRWVTGFLDHGMFLHRHLERYSSPFNHLTGEAATLYALGVIFPEFREAPAWRDRGRHILEECLVSQFHQDGGSVEQSTFYHHATLGFYILAGLLGRLNGEEFSPAVWRGIEKGIEFSMRMSQPDGKVPAIGGADDGKPLRMEHVPFWDFRAYYAIGAVLFDRADFKFAAARFHEDALWLLGPDGLERFDRLPSAAPAEASTSLRASGYFLLRSEWSSDADYVCFDCGEQAAGVRRDDIPSAVHGHADCLAVTVWLGGRPVLVDPGFYCYNGDPAWEIHFRKTGAHNTARIDGRDQALHLSKMDWCRTFAPRLEQWHADVTQAYVAGSHDGYARGPDGVTHRRTAWLRPGGYVVLFDEIEGSGTHEIELTWQFAPGTAALHDTSVTLNRTFDLAWDAPEGTRARLHHGGSGPDEGWIAASLGVRVAAPRLCLTVPFTAPRTTVLSIVADLRVTDGRTRTTSGLSSEKDWRVAAVTDGRAADWIVASGSRPVPFCETDAPLALWRTEGDSVTERRHIGGSYIRVSRPRPTLTELATP